MIKIANNTINIDALDQQYSPNSIEFKIFSKLSSSEAVYRYASLEQLKFELELRSKIIDASYALLKSRMSFKVFRDSKCNEEYWRRTEEGGFMLRPDVKPSAAIRDIFTNGSKYGTECATAMVIVYYGALVAQYPEELFNSLFSRIYLMDWQHLDPTLDIGHFRDLDDYLPGDCRYFKNPDVDPLTPEWQGENSIDLGNGTYYGHGVGIKTADEIIHTLNRFRKSGSDTSAYLMNSATRPNFKYLANRYLAFSPRLEKRFYPYF